jgi:hypothetical protein
MGSQVNKRKMMDDYVVGDGERVKPKILLRTFSAAQRHYLVRLRLPEPMLNDLKTVFERNARALLTPSVSTIFGKKFYTRDQVLYGADYWFGNQINKAQTPLPEQFSKITQWVAQELRSEAILQCDWKPTESEMSYVINRYLTGDKKIGEHSDKNVKEMADGRSVVYTVAWGDSRKMIFRSVDEQTGAKKKIHVEDCQEGYVYVMLYPQKAYTHAIDKEQDKGERVSFTGRQLNN